MRKNVYELKPQDYLAGPHFVGSMTVEVLPQPLQQFAEPIVLVVRFEFSDASAGHYKNAPQELRTFFLKERIVFSFTEYVRPCEDGDPQRYDYQFSVRPDFDTLRKTLPFCSDLLEKLKAAKGNH